MGFLDKFKKQKQVKDNTMEIQQQEKLPYDITYGVTKDGKLQFDFYDSDADFKQFYDTTRLILNPDVKRIANKPVYECYVSWYGADDAIMLNPLTGVECGRKVDYKKVLAEVDLNLLRTDREYYAFVMKKLLDKKRVDGYLLKGLRETPDILCGNYIGGVHRENSSYRKFFDCSVGEEVHYSRDMVAKRYENKMKNERIKQERIAERREKISQMEEEIKQIEDGQMSL